MNTPDTYTRQLERRVAELEREFKLLREYRSAFFRVGAEIAKDGCRCDEVEFCPPNCVRERLLTMFLRERRILAGGAVEREGE